MDANILRQPALMALSDAHSTADQEVVGSIPTGFRNILLSRIHHEKVSMVIISLQLSQEG